MTTVPRIHHVENVVCKVNFSLFPAMPWKQREDFFPFASSRSWSHLRVFSPASPLWSQSCPFTFSLSSLCLSLDLIVYASCSCLISLIPFCCVFSHVSPLFLITSLCMYCLFSEHQSSSPWVCQLYYYCFPSVISHYWLLFHLFLLCFLLFSLAKINASPCV